MKLSISNIAWSKEHDEELYKFISNNCFTGLEIAPTRLFPNEPYLHLNEAKDFANILEAKYNLQISSLQSIWYSKKEKLFGEHDEQQFLISYTKKAIDFASVINCKNLVLGSPKNRIMSDEKQYDTAVDIFKNLGNYALKKNTVLSIEPNPRLYGTNFINTTMEAFKLVKDVNNRGFQVNVDLGSIIENNENLDIIADNISLVNHIHISEPSLNSIIKRELHTDLFKILKIQSYNKYISIEMRNLENSKALKQCITYIKDIYVNND